METNERRGATAATAADIVVVVDIRRPVLVRGVGEKYRPKMKR